MVRAPESDQQTAQHLDQSLERAGAGAVKVAYNTSEHGAARRTAQRHPRGGDRFHPGRSSGRLTCRSARRACLENSSGCRTDRSCSALVAQAPIYPLFIVRTSFHHYKIIARQPIRCLRIARDREAPIEEAMQAWTRTLEKVIAEHWSQWFSLVPIFPAAMKEATMRELGYAFALPRLIGAARRDARCAGRNSAARKPTAWVSWFSGSAASSSPGRCFRSLGRSPCSCLFCSSCLLRSGLAFLLLHYRELARSPPFCENSGSTPRSRTIRFSTSSSCRSLPFWP